MSHRIYVLRLSLVTMEEELPRKQREALESTLLRLRGEEGDDDPEIVEVLCDDGSADDDIVLRVASMYDGVIELPRHHLAFLQPMLRNPFFNRDIPVIQASYNNEGEFTEYRVLAGAPEAELTATA